MPSCCVSGCKSRTARGKRTEDKEDLQKITFHKFPKCPQRCGEWLAALKRDNFTATEHSRICSKHFAENCFDRAGQYVRLRAAAIPFKSAEYFSQMKMLNSEFKVLEAKQNLQTTEIQPATEMSNSELEMSEAKQNLQRTEIQPAVSEPKENKTFENETVEPENPFFNLNDHTYTTPIHQICFSKRKSRSFNDHLYHSSYSPGQLKKKLLEYNSTIINLKKKLKVSQQKCRRLKTKVKSLEATVKNLKVSNKEATTKNLQASNKETTINNLQVSNKEATIQVSNRETTINNLQVLNKNMQSSQLQYVISSETMPGKPQYFFIPTLNLT